MGTLPAFEERRCERVTACGDDPGQRESRVASRPADDVHPRASRGQASPARRVVVGGPASRPNRLAAALPLFTVVAGLVEPLAVRRGGPAVRPPCWATRSARRPPAP